MMTKKAEEALLDWKRISDITSYVIFFSKYVKLSNEVNDENKDSFLRTGADCCGQS